MTSLNQHLSYLGAIWVLFSFLYMHQLLILIVYDLYRSGTAPFFIDTLLILTFLIL